MSFIILFIGLFIFLSFFLYGFSLIKKYQLSISENILFSILISLFIFIYYSIFLLFFNLYYNWLLLSIFLVFIFFGLKNIFYLKIIFINFFNFIKHNKLFCIIIFLQLFFLLIGSSIFPLGEDALSYHLSLPKIFLQEHKFVDRPDILNSTYPLNAELIYAIGIALKLPHISNISNWFIYILLILLIYYFSFDVFKERKISIFSVIIFITTPSIFRIVGYCKNDIILTFFTLLTCFLFWRILFNDFFLYKILFVLSFSILLGIKYHSLFFLIIFSIIIFAFFLFTNFNKKYLSLFVLIFLSILFSSVWYIKNFVITNNPVFPFLDSYFNKKVVKAEKQIIEEEEIKIYMNAKAVRHFSTLRRYEISFKNYLKFIYDLTLNFQNFDYWKYTIGPLYLIFSLLIFFNFKNFSKFDFFILFILFVYINFIYFLAPRGRFLLPVLPLFAIICARHLNHFFEKYNLIKIISIFILVITVIINLSLTLAQNTFKISIFLGIHNEELHFMKSLYYYKGFYDVVKYTNEKLNPETDKILLLVNKGFLLNVPYILGFDYMLTRYVVLYNDFANENDFLNYLKKLKINYVLYLDNLERFVNRNFYKFINELIKQEKVKIIKKTGNTYLVKLY